MNDAELVKSRLDIVEIISGYVELKKAGKDFKGNSPFRTERTPSFFVSPDKQIWHDFGDNEGGDVISFIMRMEGMTFPEALEMLADRAGVTLSRSGRPEDSSKKLRLYELVDLAMKFYHLQLSKHAPALKYVRETRGLTTESIKRYKLGYAPDGWSAFLDYAQSKKFTFDELHSAGLAGRREKGSGGYDLFRDRIMFPVFDQQGRVIGFSGRLLTDGQKAAKYINSPETPIYHKSVAIFGLHQAKQAMRKEKEIVIVEGHLDVISLSQRGLEQVVAVSGTALTSEQLVILSRQADVIKLCFDNDEAGRKAAEKAITMGLNLSSRVEVVSYDEAKDPDEMARLHPKAWKKALDHSTYALDYILTLYTGQADLSSGPAKKRLVAQIIPFLKLITDKVEQEHYLTKLSGLVGVETSLLRETLSREPRKTAPSNTKVEQPVAPKKVVTGRQEQFEEMLLELLLAYPATRIVLDDIDPADMTDTNREFFRVLKKHPKYTVKQLSKTLSTDSERVNILTLRGEHEYSSLNEHELGLEAFTQVHTVQKHIYSVKKRALSRRIAAAEQAGDFDQASDLLRQYQALVVGEGSAL
jgi:DNA primase